MGHWGMESTTGTYSTGRQISAMTTEANAAANKVKSAALDASPGGDAAGSPVQKGLTSLAGDVNTARGRLEAEIAHLGGGVSEGARTAQGSENDATSVQGANGALNRDVNSGSRRRLAG